MSATVMARRGSSLLRTVESADGDPGPPQDLAESRPETLKCTYRPADANFYCWKYGVWYNLMDCCYRHDQQTYEGCADCGQGARNLKVHSARYAAVSPRSRRSSVR